MVEKEITKVRILIRVQFFLYVVSTLSFLHLLIALLLHVSYKLHQIKSY